ncbi:MAG: hypothetical protein A2139_02410 [Desulfobacca sp. RBG_16_60_12]|nr:MAG: hypothetical protein A2139_02410 [Desulfobacca sp. RBG_16_60_12]
MATVGIFNVKESRTHAWIRNIREIVESSMLFQTVYRDLVPPGIGYWDREVGKTLPQRWRWSDHAIDLARDGSLSEPSISGHGATGSCAGWHFDYIIKDDLIEEKHAYSEVEMSRVWEWCESARYLEKPAAKGNELWCYTHWTANDIYIRARREWPDDYVVYHRLALEIDPKTSEEFSTFPERWTTEELQRERDDNPYRFSCLPAGTKITMSDWRLKGIEEVQIGDTVVGFKFGDQKNRSRLTPSAVIAIGSYNAEVFEYHLSDGGVVRCTEDHQWYNGKLVKGRSRYSPLLGLKRKHILCRVHDIVVLPDDQRTIGAYLGGMFDGEGSVTAMNGSDGASGGCLTICQSTQHPDVIPRIRASLNALGFKFHEYWRRKDCPKHGDRGMNYDTALFILRDSDGGEERGHGISLKSRFLQTCDPAKRDQVVRSMWGGRWVKEKVAVVDRRSIGVHPVYWLETETGNYVADGYASKNSQRQNRPQAGRDRGFDESWLRGGSIVIENGEHLFEINREHYDPALSEVELEQGEYAPIRVPLAWCAKYLLWDPAPSEGSEVRREQTARNGLVAAMMDPWGRLFILSAKGYREDPVSMMRTAIHTCLYWGIDRVAVEEVNFSKVYRHFANYLMSKEFRSESVSFIPQKAEKQSKDARIAGLVPPFRTGFIYLNEPECRQLRLEYKEYPHGTTRDLLDALAQYKKVLFRPSLPEEQLPSWAARTSGSTLHPGQLDAVNWGI